MSTGPRQFLVGVCALAGLGVAAPRSATAQGTTPHVFFACYIPGAGIVYRIKEAGLPQRCHAPTHVEFSWTDAAGGVTDHGVLSGLGDDDHLQYLLTDGVRATTNGFAVTGTENAGTIPATGAGVRLMWYPRKAAFRAGRALGSEWDDAAVGFLSTALGDATNASGSGSTALGLRTTASGSGSTALGFNTTASGITSTALGNNTTASGDLSTAMGASASTNGFDGSFVYGDASTSNLVLATAPNQFVVRAAGGTTLYSNAALTSGVQLSPGAGAWASVSDKRKKEHFADEDGERALARIAGLPVRSWNYKSQDPSIRHLGPTAQDFYATFGLGESDTTISTVDADGVALLAVQALERRTREQAREIEVLRAESAALRAALAALRVEIAQGASAVGGVARQTVRSAP